MWTVFTFSPAHSFRFGRRGNAASWRSDHRLAAYLKEHTELSILAVAQL